MDGAVQTKTPLPTPPSPENAASAEGDVYGQRLRNLYLSRFVEHRGMFVQGMNGWLLGLPGEKQVAAVLDVAARQTARLLLRVTAELDVELEKQDREHNRPPLPKGSAFPPQATDLLEQRDRLLDIQAGRGSVLPTVPSTRPGRPPPAAAARSW